MFGLGWLPWCCDPFPATQWCKLDERIAAGSGPQPFPGRFTLAGAGPVSSSPSACSGLHLAPGPSPRPGVQPQELFCLIANSRLQRRYHRDQGFVGLPNPREPCESRGYPPRGLPFHWWAWQREQRPRPLATHTPFGHAPLPADQAPGSPDLQKSWRPGVRSLRLLIFTLRAGGTCLKWGVEIRFKLRACWGELKDPSNICCPQIARSLASHF